MVMKMLKTDGILFDVDGTLWDSTVPAAKVWQRVAAGYPEITDEISAERLKSFYGLPLEDIAKRMFKSVPFEKALSVMERCVREQCPYLLDHKGELLGDVGGVFKALQNKGIKVFIVSNCRAGYIEAFLQAYGYGDLCLDHLCPGDTGLLKADNIKKIVEKWGLKAPIYVGDTDGDEVASRDAGVPFIFAAYGFGKADSFAQKIDKLEDLPGIVEPI